MTDVISRHTQFVICRTSFDTSDSCYWEEGSLERTVLTVAGSGESGWAFGFIDPYQPLRLAILGPTVA